LIVVVGVAVAVGVTVCSALDLAGRYGPPAALISANIANLERSFGVVVTRLRRQLAGPSGGSCWERRSILCACVGGVCSSRSRSKRRRSGAFAELFRRLFSRASCALAFDQKRKSKQRCGGERADSSLCLRCLSAARTGGRLHLLGPDSETDFGPAGIRKL
jgi:hypothetical protein